MSRKPNFLVIVVDEERYPPSYESPELIKWKEENLKFQNHFSKRATVFHNHYTNTTACVPGRATLHTGQYPLVTSVTQTDGIAKSADDPGMFWLDKFTVPTIGNYFNKMGYKTIMKGKWHVSDSAIKFKNGRYLNTFDNDGNPIPELEDFYLEKNVLKDYGYNGWIGPEPHGMLPLNSASSVPLPKRGRDIGYTEQIINELDELNNSSEPWLLMATYLNPHDITLFGALADSPNSEFEFKIDESLPENLFTSDFQKTLHDDLDTKPAAQKAYRNLYNRAIQPITNMDKYHRFYYSAQKYVDENIQQVWKKLRSLDSYKNTIILYVSDHGDLLSSHNHMYQKWYNAYQETIHVPFMISSPLFGNKHQDIYDLTSHIDILPTMLGFTRVDVDCLRKKLMKKFSLALPLAGSSLVGYFTKHVPKANNQVMYFYTEDDPFRGENQYNILCRPYEAIPQPNHVEAIITYFSNELWKITTYFGCECQNNCSNDIIGELYNLKQDPMELNNLYYNENYVNVRDHLQKILSKYSFKYRGTQ